MTASTPTLNSLPSLSVLAATNNSLLTKKKIGIVGGSIGGLAAAACLQKAGFCDITLIERATEHRPGNGIGLDDASVAILKGLGFEMVISNEDGESEDSSSDNSKISVQQMRLTEERVLNPDSPDSTDVALQQPYPYSAVLYSELAQGLEFVVKNHVSGATMIRRGCKVVDIQKNKKSYSLDVSVEDLTRNATATKQKLEFDLVIVADGPRSRFRHYFNGNSDRKKGDLRFSGYTAWRGTVPEKALPRNVVQQLRDAYPDLSNCLYFVWGPPGKSAVIYDIGQGLVNWLIYETTDTPKAPPGRTTTTATPDDILSLQRLARSNWGVALGAVIELTPTPFQNDIYDIQEPLNTMHHSFDNGKNDENNQPMMCILGDAAHPISPHCAKGSNLAIHDAHVLACAAQQATSLKDMLQVYSNQRVTDTRNTVLLSRHLGRIRNSMPPLTINGNLLKNLPRPTTAQEIEKQVKLGGLPTVTLPTGSSTFNPIWEFTDQTVPMKKRGFCLDSLVSPTEPLPALDIVQVNHISLETENVDRLVAFYHNVLGLEPLPRPNFGFGGAWFQLPGGIALHVIERDPEKPGSKTLLNSNKTVPERFIRRSRHMALTVLDIETAKSTLQAHGIEFAINKVPDTSIEQVFLYDPDGNGVEIGNFGRL